MVNFFNIFVKIRPKENLWTNFNESESEIRINFICFSVQWSFRFFILHNAFEFISGFIRLQGKNILLKISMKPRRLDKYVIISSIGHIFHVLFFLANIHTIYSCVIKVKVDKVVLLSRRLSGLSQSTKSECSRKTRVL